MIGKENERIKRSNERKKREKGKQEGIALHRGALCFNKEGDGMFRRRNVLS